ncbi:hypothetical protein QUF84_00225 [Fictibacillus enclensis]|uniref:hypothetical protein n=1 Tax=Fictibacillus enclensis TaxID=1017270 RepID=UPI00259FEBFB|nr:hypothetical protein [Fictibacillus enclensis]MDM5335722.1 hypothetical protein [Fictibacillus enclensis]
MSTDKNEEEKLREALECFEEGFPDAVYAVPHEPREPRIKVYKLISIAESIVRDRTN